MRIAIIGSGVAGMTAAHLLHPRFDVHLFEADQRPGGHAHTVAAEVAGEKVALDTGFLVYNERTYPLFAHLLEQLGVATHPSDMSFSVSDEVAGLEWRGTSPRTVFAQPRNLFRPDFLAMLADVVRFNGLARKLLDAPEAEAEAGSLADLLSTRRWSAGFLRWYLIPLGSAIWSADPETFTSIPARTFSEFFSRHGLLRLGDQARWRTITGGSSTYVDALVAPLARAGRLHLGTPVLKLRRSEDQVELFGPGGPASFDHVIVATHSDQALALLGDPTPDERATLGAIRYQPNRATLHTDIRLLPRTRRSWAAWNYHRVPGTPRRAILTYFLNRLQGLAIDQPVLVTVNRDEAIDENKVLARFDYAHPVIDQAAVAAQSRQLRLSADSTSYCGAYWGYGFHEDGVASALAVCRRFGASL